MVAHLSTFIILFFVGILIGAGVILLLVTPKAAQDVQKIVARRNKNRTNKGSGDKGISALMEELSRTKNRERVDQLTKIILEEVTKMESETVNRVQLRKVEIIQKWLDSFSPEQHIRDLKTNGISQQVQFDNDKKDFKLMILKK